MRLTLANIREGNNLTQTELSRLAKVSQGYYSDIESGFKCPSPPVAERIAAVLNIPEEDMFRIFYSDGQRKITRSNSTAAVKTALS